MSEMIVHIEFLLDRSNKRKPYHLNLIHSYANENELRHFQITKEFEMWKYFFQHHLQEKYGYGSRYHTSRWYNPSNNLLIKFKNYEDAREFFDEFNNMSSRTLFKRFIDYPHPGFSV